VGIGTESHSGASTGAAPQAGSAPARRDRSATAAISMPSGPVRVVIALTVLAAVLRFATLDVQSIWLDESATLILVHRGFAGMLSHLSASESAPPLYYVLAWAWTKVFGAGALGFRSFSALVGTITVPVLYAAGRRISTRAGLWAAALAAVNPAMFYYSQEARAYALLILFSAAALVLWQRALELPSGRRLGLWAGMSALAVLTHYFAAFLFLPEAIVLGGRLGWRRVLAPAGAVVLVGIALAPLALRQREDGKTDWIEATSLPSRIAESAKQFLVGLYGPLEILTAAATGLLAFAAIALLLRCGSARERDRAREVAVVAVVAVALPLVLAATHLLDVFDGRNIIAAWTPCAVLVAAGLGAARAPRAGNLLGCGLLGISLAVILGVLAIPGYQRDDWRDAAHALSPERAARVIVSKENASIPLSIYLSGELRSAAGARVTTREIDFLALRTPRTGRSPLAPAAPIGVPPGFRLAGSRHSETYAVSRFLAAHATTVSDATLRRIAGERSAEVIIQR
jgi:mannosyltransferase